MWRSSLLVLAVLLCGCERYPSGGDVRIRRDMVDQQSYRPQEDPRGLPEGAIPVKGWEPFTTRDAAIGTLRNPVAKDPASLERGRKLYGIYCTHCHGEKAAGDGPVAAKFVKPANLGTPEYAAAPDGLFYYTIRYGTPMMPPQAEVLAPCERWEIVHWVRKLEGR